MMPGGSVGPGRAAVNARWFLHGAALLRATRAASARGLAEAAWNAAGRPDDLERVRDLAARWRAEERPADDAGAFRQLAGEDLSALLDHAREIEPRLAAWRDPATAAEAAASSARSALAALGVEAPDLPVEIVDRMPAPYDAPCLDAVSLDASDATHLGRAQAVLLRRDRVAPGFTEGVLGHAVVHSALGRRSPDLLGRGLEEGLCEILGALHAAASSVGEDAADAAFAGRRLTPTLSAHREAFLDQVRGAALLHRAGGLAGLAFLVREGRAAVKAAERALAAGRPQDAGIPNGAVEPAFAARLDRLLLARSRPLAVGPLAFRVATALAAAASVGEAAGRLGIPADAALRAARELVDGPFVLVLSDSGEVLASDLALALDSGMLRYRMH